MLTNLADITIIPPEQIILFVIKHSFICEKKNVQYNTTHVVKGLIVTRAVHIWRWTAWFKSWVLCFQSVFPQKHTLGLGMQKITQFKRLYHSFGNMDSIPNLQIETWPRHGCRESAADSLSTNLSLSPWLSDIMKGNFKEKLPAII